MIIYPKDKKEFLSKENKKRKTPKETLKLAHLNGLFKKSLFAVSIFTATMLINPQYLKGVDSTEIEPVQISQNNISKLSNPNFSVQQVGDSLNFGNRSINLDEASRIILKTQNIVENDLPHFKNLRTLLSELNIHGRTERIDFISNWVFGHLMIETNATKPNKPSSAGAIGMAQIKPSTYDYILTLYPHLEKELVAKYNTGKLGFEGWTGKLHSYKEIKRELSKDDESKLLVAALENEDIALSACATYLERRADLVLNHNRLVGKDTSPESKFIAIAALYNGGTIQFKYAREVAAVAISMMDRHD